MRFLLSGALALLIAVQGAFAYSDTENYAWENSIQALSDQGILEGYSDGTFRPSAKINRAEFVKIVIRARYGEQAYQNTGGSCFPDVPASSWYAKYVCFARAQGILKGYPNGTFQPGNQINQAEALKILLLTFEKTSESTSNPWYQSYFSTAVEVGMFYFAGGKEAPYLITRGEMSYFTAWLLAGEARKPDQLEGIKEYTAPFTYTKQGTTHTLIMDASQVNMRIMTGNESIREKECDLPHHCVAEAQAESFESFIARSHGGALMNGAYFDAYSQSLNGTNFHQISSDLVIDGEIRSMYGWDEAFGNGGMLTQLKDSTFQFFHPIREWMKSEVVMGLSNYPFVLENGHVRTRSEIGVHDENDAGFWKSLRRGGLGLSKDRTRIYYSSTVGTVEDLGKAMVNAGAWNGFALDSGSSNGFFLQGTTIFPPARKLTTVIEFYER